MTMISDLPKDIVEEILSRVPLKFMRAVRLTCKKWKSLSKNRSILKEEESQMIVMMNNKLYLMSVVINGDPYREPKGKFTCLTQQLKVSQVCHCEGLLLCIFKDNNKNTKLMIWNPYCLQPKWLEPRGSYNGLLGLYYCCYGLGYVDKENNKSCGRSHKIVRFIDVSLFNFVVPERFFWYEIYDIESESWRTLDITPLWSIWFHGFGITVKGNTYWCVNKATVADEAFYIICFDFTKERFGPLMHLPFNADVNQNRVNLSCVREEKLAASLQNSRPNAHGFEIWITTEIEDEKLTWSKFLTVNMGPEISCTLESFIVDEEKKLVIAYGDDDKITVFGEFGYVRELYLFEESANFNANRASCKRQKEETRQCRKTSM